jgi:hypothetical protein
MKAKFKAVSFKIRADVEMAADDSEINTGVDAPGISLEPLVGSEFTFQNKDEQAGSIILVEIGTPHFVF